MTEDRKGKVAVEVGVPVTREVLAAGEDSAIVEASGEREGVLNDDFLGVAERSVANHRVERVGVHIENGCEVEVDSDRAQLLPEDGCCIARQRRITRRRQLLHGRKSQDGINETSYSPAFLIDGDELRELGIGVFQAGSDQLDRLIDVLDVALEEDQTSYGSRR